LCIPVKPKAVEISQKLDKLVGVKPTYVTQISVTIWLLDKPVSVLTKTVIIPE